jgi:N,N'-diacetyllegionaminate synthase
MKVRIGTRLIGDGEPCFIIAEAGVNHNGSFELAKKLIDTAHTAQADAVKFQTFNPEELVTACAEKAEYQKRGAPEESQYEMLKKLQLKKDDFLGLASYAEKKGITFLSTPFDRESVDLLCDVVPAFKIPSGEITNFPLLRYVRDKRKPIILSTGMATLAEVEDALDIFRRDVVLLHCVTDYPASMEEVNLRAIATLRHAFGVPVGFSDHTRGMTASVAAVALGACVIEKHFTLDRTLPGPDHRASLEPDELRELVRAIRDVEKALGTGIKRPTPEEETIKKVVRKSVVAVTDIPEGTRITPEMVNLKRPGTGIEPRYLELVIGRKAQNHIKDGQVITFDDI